MRKKRGERNGGKEGRLFIDSSKMTLLYHRLIHLFQGREYSNVGVS